MEIDDPMLSVFIYLIAELPPHPPVTLDTVDEQLLLLHHRLRYKALSLFLRWIRLGEPQSEALLLPEVQDFEPMARFWDSVLTLATEVHPRSEDELIRAFKSPAELWFACLCLNSRDGFAQSLTGYPQPRPKKEAIRNARVQLKYLAKPEDFNKIGSSQRSQRVSSDPTPKDATKQRCSCLTTWLIVEAAKMAATDRSFDKRFYRPWMRTFKRYVSAANERENFQLGWIDPEGQLFMTKQTRKRPPSTKE